MVATRKSVMVDPNAYGDPKSPPTDIYTLTFDRIEDFDFGKPFPGEEPKQQFTLVFTLDYPDDEDEDELDGMEIKGWYTPKFRALEGKQVPKLYTLLCALNGGEYTCPDGPFDGWDELEQFEGKKFRCVVGPNDKGWARLQGDPLPLKTKKTKVQVIAVTNPDEDDEEDAGKF
jgi:hypothetical protein